jgi:peptidyl-prolyl cis-trans isomerase C
VKIFEEIEERRYRMTTNPTWNQRKMVLILVILGVWLMTSNCSNNHEQTPIVARVGPEVLTLDEMRETIPPGLETVISEAQLQNYIQRWIDSHVLYQEALRNQIHLLPHVAERLEEIQRELIIAKFLDIKINDGLYVTDQETEVYYNQNRDEFIRPEELRRIWVTVVGSRSEANTLRRRLQRGSDSEQIAKGYSLDPSSENGGDLGFIKRDRLPKAVGDQAFALAIGRISLPIATNSVYYLIKVIDIRKMGEQQELEEVNDRIRELLLVQKRNQEYDQLLASLKESANIQRNFDLVTELVDSQVDSESTVMNNSIAP